MTEVRPVAECVRQAGVEAMLDRIVEEMGYSDRWEAIEWLLRQWLGGGSK